MFGDGGHRLGGGSSNAPLGYNRAPGATGDWEDDCGLSVQNPVAVGCGLALLLLFGFAAVISLGSVPPLQVGIRYNGFTKAADTTSFYQPGRYFIGPFNKFLLFPSTVQTIEFMDDARLMRSGVRYEPLHTRTKDGLGLHLQVSLQYKLVQKSLGKLYNEFNQNYDQVITSSVRDVLIKAASGYEATELWEKREAFGNRMQSMVNEELQKTYAECWGLQLMLIDLPDVFEHRIVVTQVQKQQMLIKEQEQQSLKIRAETDVIRAEYDRKVKVIMAGGHANYTVKTQSAHAEATKRKISVESKVMGSLKERLGLNPASLVDYNKYWAMDELEDAEIYFGFAGPSQVLVGGVK